MNDNGFWQYFLTDGVFHYLSGRDEATKYFFYNFQKFFTYSQFPNIRGGGDISTFLKFWEGGNHLLGPPPYSVFENFGGGVPTFRTPPYSVFEKKIYPFNF